MSRPPLEYVLMKCYACRRRSVTMYPDVAYCYNCGEHKTETVETDPTILATWRLGGLEAVRELLKFQWWNNGIQEHSHG